MTEKEINDGFHNPMSVQVKARNRIQNGESDGKGNGIPASEDTFSIDFLTLMDRDRGGDGLTVERNQADAQEWRGSTKSEV